MAAKRGNPIRTKADIEADIESHRLPVPPQPQALPNAIGGVKRLMKAYDDAVLMKQLRKNPPPSKAGAKVTGFKRPDTTA